MSSTASLPLEDAPARAGGWLYRLAVASLVATIGLTIGIGGTITSTETGMAYPTWPNINSGSLFSMFYLDLAEAFGWGAVVEHTHRQAGALTGLLVLATAVVSWRRKDTPSPVRKLATWALILVTVQGILGGARVLGNSYAGAIVHAIGAQLCVALIVVLVRRAAPGWERPGDRGPAEHIARLRLWSGAALVLLFVNLFAAASLRHKQGQFEGHLVLAILTAVVLYAIGFLVLKGFPDAGALRRDARRLFTVLGVQVVLGLCAYLFLLGPLTELIAEERVRFTVQAVIATGHLLFGVLVLSLATSIWVEARFRLLPAGAAAPSSGRAPAEGTA